MSDYKSVEQTYRHTLRIFRPFNPPEGLYNTILDVLLARAGLGAELEIREPELLGASILKQRTIYEAAKKYPALNSIAPADLLTKIQQALEDTQAKPITTNVMKPRLFRGNDTWHLGVALHSPTVQEEMGIAKTALYGLIGTEYSGPPETNTVVHVSFASAPNKQMLDSTALALRNAFPRRLELQPIDYLDVAIQPQPTTPIATIQ